MLRPNGRDEKKREPLLADRFVTKREWGANLLKDDRIIPRLQQMVRTCPRYVFGEEGAARVGRVVATIPDLLVREREFARAPFETCWIEYPHWRYWQEVVTPDTKPEMSRDGDHSIGYLIDHNAVYVVMGGTVSHPKDPPQLYPITYHLNTEWPMESQITFCESLKCSRIALDIFMWGSTYERLAPSEQRLLRATNALSLLPMQQQWLDYVSDKGGFNMLQGGVGELRTIVALLLMLNRPKVTRFVEQGTKRGFIGNKVIPFLSHRTVEVDLDATITMRSLGKPAGATGIKLREHERSGHYRHDRVAHEYMRIAGCIHTWAPTHGPSPNPKLDWAPWPDCPLDIDVRRHWVCGQCGGKRWRVDDYKAGDSTLGVVIKDKYDVSAGDLRE